MSAESGSGAGSLKNSVSAQRVEPRQALEIAAHAKAAVADEIARAIEHRQSRQFHAQPRAAIDRPVQRDAAPGVAGREGFGDAAFRIEAEHLGDLAPEPAQASGGARADQAGEFIGAEQEAAFGVHLPHEAQRMPPRVRRLVQPWRHGNGPGSRLDGLQRRG